MNLMTDLDLGGKIVQETGVSFNVIILEMVTIKGQSQKKYDQFLAQYASRLLQPICLHIFTLNLIILLLNTFSIMCRSFT